MRTTRYADKADERSSVSGVGDTLAKISGELV